MEIKLTKEEVAAFEWAQKCKGTVSIPSGDRGVTNAAGFALILLQKIHKAPASYGIHYEKGLLVPPGYEL